MAKYCRYCGQKMSAPRDKFCYSCREPGEPVDYFYRFAKKVDMDNDEIDLIRSYGENLILGGLIAAFFVGALLTASLVINAVSAPEADRVSDGFIVIMIAILAVFLTYAAIGVGLMLLDKRFVDRKWKISAIMFFVGLFRSNRGGAAIISAALTHKKKKEQENRLAIALTHLANGERPVKKVEEAKPATGWKCRFCGYENRKSSFSCKSCGKEKDTRLS